MSARNLPIMPSGRQRARRSTSRGTAPTTSGPGEITKGSNLVFGVGIVLVVAELLTYVVADNKVPRDLLTTLAQVQATLLVAVAVLPVARTELASVASTAGALGAALWGTLATLMVAKPTSSRIVGGGLALILAATMFGGAQLFSALDRPRGK